MTLWTQVAAIVLAQMAGLAALTSQGSAVPAPANRETSAATSESAQAPKELEVGGRVIGKRVEPQAGELCLLCSERLHASDPVYLVQGQRVPVHQGRCESKLRAQPQQWLARLKPQGALFSAEAEPLALSPVWFFAGLYVLVGLIFAGACAHQAVRKALPPIRWFFAGLLLNAVGYLILLTRSPGGAEQFPAGIPGGLRKVPRTYSFVECPGCGYHNHPAAGSCPGCGAQMTPPFESEAARWRKQSLQ